MKSNDLQAAMAAFLQNNPNLDSGIEPETEKPIESVDRKSMTLHVAIDKKGRHGKTATIIDGLGDLDDVEIAELAQTLKKQLGVGGSFRGDEILIQGQHLEEIKRILVKEGFKVK